MYRRNYLCVVEGQQEQMYLKHLAKLLTDFPKTVVTFNTSIGNAYKLTKSYEEYDKACLFDFDFNKSEFENNLSICLSLNKPKQKYKIYHAYSNVCFDLWLLLHKTDYQRSVTSNDAYVEAVIKAYGLSSDTDIKSAKSMEAILSKITLDDVKMAISRAKKIKERKISTDAHKINNVEYYDNPDFSLDIFIAEIIGSTPNC